MAITAHNDKKQREAAQTRAQQQAEQKAAKRLDWTAKLSEGMTPRQLAATDPGFIEDGEFQQFWNSNAPEPEAAPAEMFEDVQDPFNRGGFGQRSSTTGKIVNYQGPTAEPQEQQRRVMKGPGGRNRYLDDSSLVFPDVQAPEAAAPEPEQAKFEHVRALAGDWVNATEPVRALARQRDLMQIGLDAARGGDMAAGSQAVLVTFQKILDPTSVVRESEYARSSSGLSVVERVKGAAEKLQKGGAGVSISELQGFARLADEAVTKLGSGWLTQEQDRIGGFADAYNIPREYVFQSGGPAPQQAPQAAAPQAIPLVAQQEQLPPAPRLPETFRATSAPAQQDAGGFGQAMAAMPSNQGPASGPGAHSHVSRP